MLRTACLTAGLLWTAFAAQASTLIVRNMSGDVRVVVTADARMKLRGQTPSGPAKNEDFAITQSAEEVQVEVLPRESPLDLTISLPLGYAFEANTDAGDISIEGMIHLVRLETKTGAIRLKAPLEGIRVSIDAATPPAEFINPDRRLFRTSEASLAAGQPWRLRDRLDEDAIIYGDYQVTAAAPAGIELTKFTAPTGWPLRFHADALDELGKTLEPSAAGGSMNSDTPASVNADGELVFNARVRMVNLSVAVSDAKGNPVPGLTAADFRVVEENAEQRIGMLHDGDAAFNLAIVLDMSGSAIAYREPMQAAARRFVEMARPGDRVAIYALTFGMFQVVSPLTSNREELLEAVNNLPAVAGASPLFDIITLSYAQELRQLPGERNALIVISDGLDNRITGGTGPSTVKFNQLERMAKEMNAIIYPVLLLSAAAPRRGAFTRSAVLVSESRGRAFRQMRDLAAASGGRLFPAKSIEDLEPVFPLIESELRSVYTLGYYPKNQDLDGGWRTLDVSVDKPKVTVRARPGYYAK